MQPRNSLYCSQPKLSGFTLIELLTVIAVLAILVAVVFPTAGAIRERALESSATSHVRQMGVGLLSLMVERDGVMRHRNGGSGSGAREDAMWPEQLAEFLDFDRHVFFCATTPTGFAEGQTPYTSGVWSHRVAFGVNHDTRQLPWTTTREEGEWQVGTLRFIAIEEPSNRILVASAKDARGFGRYSLYTDFSTHGGSPSIRYRNRAVASFFDGSTRMLTAQDLGQLGFRGAFGPSGERISLN